MATLQETYQNKVESISGKVADATLSFSGGLASKLEAWKIPEGTKFENNMKKLELDNIDLRSKLEVQCPDFLKQCGLCKIDFGTLFLSPHGEKMVAQAQNITNDVINSINGIQQYLTPEALNAAISLVQFLITDLIGTLTSYALRVMSTYINPAFYTGLALDIVTGSLSYTSQYTKSPAVIIEEIKKDNPEILKEEKKKEDERKTKDLMTKANAFMSDTLKTIESVMDEIQPYTSEISKYMVMGPDYAIDQVEAIYKRYLNMGIDIVDEQLNIINQTIDEYVDSAAEAAGKWAAEEINDLQRKSLEKAMKKADTKIVQAKVKAMGLINKAILNLMAMLGG